jgi:glutamate carboxypeptidase
MPESMKRAGHLVATREGSRGKRILLIGHLDTVLREAQPRQAWDRKGNRVRGQGVIDMKGGDVAMIEALRALARRSGISMTPRSRWSSWATRSAADRP